MRNLGEFAWPVGFVAVACAQLPAETSWGGFLTYQKEGDRLPMCDLSYSLAGTEAACPACAFHYTVTPTLTTDRSEEGCAPESLWTLGGGEDAAFGTIEWVDHGAYYYQPYGPAVSITRAMWFEVRVRGELSWGLVSEGGEDAWRSRSEGRLSWDQTYAYDMTEYGDGGGYSCDPYAWDSREGTSEGAELPIEADVTVTGSLACGAGVVDTWEVGGTGALSVVILLPDGTTSANIESVATDTEACEFGGWYSTGRSYGAAARRVLIRSTPACIETSVSYQILMDRADSPASARLLEAGAPVSDTTRPRAIRRRVMGELAPLN